MGAEVADAEGVRVVDVDVDVDGAGVGVGVVVGVVSGATCGPHLQCRVGFLKLLKKLKQKNCCCCFIIAS